MKMNILYCRWRDIIIKEKYWLGDTRAFSWIWSVEYQ